jgi:hypothetical protein
MKPITTEDTEEHREKPLCYSVPSVVRIFHV